MAEAAKIEGWKIDQLQRRLYWTQLQYLQSTDPVLTISKPELIGPIRGPSMAPRAATSKMKALQRLIQFRQGASFVSGAFNVQVFLDCHLEQVTAASRSLFKKLISPVIMTRPIANS